MDDNILDLITARLSGNATTEQAAELEQWLRQSPEHQQDFDKLQRLWDQSASLGHLAQVDMQQDWEAIRQRMAPAEKSSPSKWWRIAASFALVLIGVTIVAYLLSSPEGQQYAALNGPESVALSDGSVVYLNEGAVLTLASNFGDIDRQMQLRGEAYFEVSPDLHRPFIISTGSAQTKVLGTAFNLKQSEHASSIQVTHGKVAFSTNQKEVILTAGMAASVQENAPYLTALEPNFLAWHTQKLTFQNTALSEVFKTLEKHYKVEIETKNLKENLKLTSVFDRQSIEEVLDEIVLIHGLTWTKLSDNKYQITSGQ